MIRSIGLGLAFAAGATVLTIPRGTDIPVTLDEDVPIEQDRVGDTFEAHVTRDLIVMDEVVIPAGSPAKVKLVNSPEKSDAATLRLTGVNVDGEMRSVSTDAAEADSDKQGLNTAEKTAVGAAAGAVVGAGGGLAWGLLDKQGREVPDDTPLRFSLKEKLDL
jgi:hypothetical protein